MEKNEHANRLEQDRDRLARDVTELQSVLSSQQRALADNQENSNRLALERDRLARDVTEVQSALSSHKQALLEQEKHASQLEGNVIDLQVTMEVQRRALKEEGTRHLVAERERLGREAVELQTIVQAQQQALSQNEREVAHLREECEAIAGQLKALKDERTALMEQGAQVQGAMETQQKELVAIKESLAWLYIIRYRSARDKLFPRGTYRRNVYDRLKNSLKDLARLGVTGLLRKTLAKTGISDLSRVWCRKAYTLTPLKSLTPSEQNSDNPNVHDAIQWIPVVKIDGKVKAGFFMHPPASVSYRLTIPPRAVFYGSIALMPDVWGRNPGGVEFEIKVLSCSNGRQLKRNIFIHPTRFLNHRHWREFRASLRRFANQDVELILSTLVPPAATADFAWAVWGEPVILARKSFHQMRARAMHHVKLMGFRELVSKIVQDARSSSALENPIRTADGVEITDTIWAAKQEQSKSFGSVVATWKAELESFLADRRRHLTFPSYENPRVSIVIPTFNKAEYLYQCLNSVLSHTNVPYHVIVVDDCSEDLTTHLLNKIKNIHTVRNDQNLDFLRSCNKGASFARGPYILFLNNDVVVTPHWLSVLVSTIEEIPNCGAVGAKLIHPDGTLQEAGSIIWQDGSAMGYGRNDDPLKPEYCYRREVDYSSAACLLVREELFRNLGGFDERYVPAYYEESDLCFAIRERGYKIIYEPQVTVLHYEFGSRSFERAKVLMETNQQKLTQKWEGRLSEQYPYGSTLKARDRRRGRRILVMDDQIPDPYLGSGFPRAHKLIEFLCELEFVVTFVPLGNSTAYEPTTQRLQQLGVEVFYGNNFVPEAILRSRAEYYDVVIISRPHNGAKYLSLARACFPNALVIYDAEALFCLREFLRAEVEGRSFTETLKRSILEDELGIMREADVIITVSETERQVILKEQAHDSVVVWGHTHDLYKPSTPFTQRKDLLFVGGFVNGHPPNTDAICYFVEKLFPRIRERLPGCRLIVVGSEPSEQIQKLSSSDILVTGFVENIAQYYEECRVFIVPLRFGAGINYKLTEAMSYSIPAVISPLAAVGLNIQDGQEAFVARNDDEFAEKVVRLYEDEALWTRVQQTAQSYVLDHFSPQRMKIRLLDILNFSRKPPEKETADLNSVEHVQDTGSPNDATDRTWSDVARDKADCENWKLLSWDGHPCVGRYINRRISGNPAESWLQFVKRRFCPEPLSYGLSLGCGWGSLERDAIRLGVCERLDAYDIASGAIETAKTEAIKNGLQDRIRYFCADLNSLVLEADSYDICFAAASLHHVRNLEHVLQQVHAALHPEGMFIVIEYVGPSRFQWDDQVSHLMNKILSLLPEGLRTDLRDGKTIRMEAIRPSIDEVIRIDPTEAVRSQEIVTKLEKKFTTIYRADFGGTLLQFALANIVGNFRENDPKDMALLELISLFEETLIDKGVIPSDFVFLACQPNSGGVNGRRA